MKRLYFGTDGVRGPYGSAQMNEELAWRLGAAAAAWLRENGVGPGATVLIGRDTRQSGAALEQALADGLAQGGLGPRSLAILPTPAVSLAVRRQRAALGVVITASHNPATDNGIKFFGPQGLKLTDEQEARIEALMPAQRTGAPAGPLGAVDGITDYLRVITESFPCRLTGWRIVLDTAHGATVETSGRVLRAAGAEVIALGAAPDGRNINAGVGSEHPEALGAAVRAHGARLGIAHDGDGDRCVLCDELGAVLDGDEILTILALHALAQGRLAQRLLVTTQQSNLGVEAALEAAGGRVVRTPIGDRYVTERMRAEGASLGGESSGHIICAEVTPTGDGLVAALKVIEVMVATGRPLSELRRALVKFPQRSLALRVREKRPLETLPGLTGAVRALEAELGARGRVLVRYSGTESKLRLLIEGPTDAVVAAGLERLQVAARAELEVL
ncbi:Phosphoglucosamine mutase [Lacunisphaera limnophila]|uniref:Phosphoglucosamine mutase n=1 Tax=Lacunisphaera limnophila TaxID=1838286 RepID=A0A1D8AWZ8_9BACT|nr:phosphoglucosamine mutase [Lacunisphaera limnophila]AOS45414.1 Phosphoglucosamine mutase [Lacunisphaera limnophila]